MCQLNSSHICPYFLRLLGTFSEKIKRETERTMFAKKKVCKSTQQCIICCLRPDILSRQKKNQRRFQGAPLECTNYILFLKKKWEKNGGRCVVANTLAVDICFKNSSKFLMEFLFVVTEEILYSITAVFDQGSQAKPLILLVE